MNEQQMEFLRKLNDQLPAHLAKKLREHFPHVFFPKLLKADPANGHYLWLDRPLEE